MTDKELFQRAKEFSRAAVERGCIPITPHIYLTQFMDDTVPAERVLGLSIGRELVLMCDELWAFGLDCPTAGMAAEIELARERGIHVLNGFKAISEIPETEKQDEDPQDAGSVIIRVPAFTDVIVKRYIRITGKQNVRCVRQGRELSREEIAGIFGPDEEGGGQE